jgi:hypothetical protein
VENSLHVKKNLESIGDALNFLSGWRHLEQMESAEKLLNLNPNISVWFSTSGEESLIKWLLEML